MTIPIGAVGGNKEGSGEKGSLKNQATAAEDAKNFAAMKRTLTMAMQAAPMKRLASHVRFVQTQEGLRIDLVDDADYSMFALGTTQLVPEADKLIGLIAQTIQGTQNPIMIRGHTDSLGYGNPTNMNNWDAVVGPRRGDAPPAGGGRHAGDAAFTVSKASRTASR